MNKRNNRIFNLFMTLTLVAPTCAWSMRSPQNAPPSLYGLEQINMDKWTELLKVGREKGSVLQQMRSSVFYAISTAASEQAIFSTLQNMVASARLTSVEDYRDLALLLLEARQRLRHSHKMDLGTLQDSLFLLQMMAEESLYVGSKKFSDFPKEMTILGPIKNTSRSAALRDFSVQTGDVALSKATGFGSSSFIALAMDRPHIYSHSTPVVISEQGRAISPEAEIEDGVKLRDMQKDYIDGSKTRLSIYRYEDGSIQSKVEQGAQNLVNEMYQRSGNDPFNVPAFKYDFSMTPGHLDERGLFCSSVAYELYR
ncbi:MAG: hypothetical protein AAGB31_14520, partial [Bdellovibrio sp.]